MILFFLGLSERQAAQEIFAVLLLFFHGEEGNGIDGLVSVVDHDFAVFVHAKAAFDLRDRGRKGVFSVNIQPGLTVVGEGKSRKIGLALRVISFPST